MLRNVLMRIPAALLALALMTAPAWSVSDSEITVYITKTGHKYHRESCQYLRQSKIKTTLEKAKAKGLEPCKVCTPPK